MAHVRSGGAGSEWGGIDSAGAGAGAGAGVGVGTDPRDFIIEHLRLAPTRYTPHDDPAPLPALLTRPAGPGPFPAVLYCHAHGNDYARGKRELLDGRRSLPEGAYGPVLAARGIAALCIDLPCFGERASAIGEVAMAKRYLWHGDTLFGAMLRELAAALDHLLARPDIDAARVATLGLSMGSTTAWWLAALDERVCAVAELCCLADMSTSESAHSSVGCRAGIARHHVRHHSEPLMRGAR